MSQIIFTPEAERLWHEFRAELRAAHLRDGKKSLRWLAERSERLAMTITRTTGIDPLTRAKPYSFSKTTVSRVLSMNAEPRWEFVVAFLRALDTPDETIMKLWHPKWVALMSEMHPYRLESIAEEPAPEIPPGVVCPRCGCWVVDMERHRIWHADNGTWDSPPPIELPARRLRAITGGRADRNGASAG